MTDWIYLLRSKDRIKIGTTQRLRARVLNIGTSSADAVEFLCAFPGNSDHEKALHQTFSAFRVRGEWFVEAGAMAEFVIYSLQRDDAILTLPAQEKVTPDKYTQEAMAWAARLAEIRRERTGLCRDAARKAVGVEYGMAQGFLENLYRGRISAISADAYFAMHDALLNEGKSNLAEMKSLLARLRQGNCENEKETA